MRTFLPTFTRSIIFFAILCGLCVGHSGNSNESLRGWRKRKALQAEAVLARQCELNLLTIDELSRRLEDLVGKADQTLTEQDYGTPVAKEYSEEIKFHANSLALRTGSGNALALESFKFAAEISSTSRK